AGELLLLEEVQGLPTPRVVDSSDLRHRLEASKDVIPEVERIVKPEELWVHDSTAVPLEEQVPAEEHLRRAHGRVPRRGVLRSIGVKVKPKHRVTGFPVRGSVGARVSIAVPTT